MTCWLTLATTPPAPAQPPTDQSAHSESSLPSYYYTSPSDRVQAEGALPSSAAALPSESTVPGKQRVAAPQQNLPDESRLPKPVAAQPAPQDNSLQDILADSRDHTPWLRLIEAEHTAPIRVIELDASGKNLFTAGEDKVVHHWKLVEKLAVVGHWQHHATYRWQVQRGERGTILSLVSNGDELFIAGAGADGQQGEIVAINTVTGAWLAPLIDPRLGHHSPILKTRMLSSGPQRRLVSLDHQHGIGLWTQDPNLGTWSFRSLRRPSANQQFQFAPMDVIDPRTLVVASQANPWTIDFIDVDSGARTRQLRRDAKLVNQQGMAQAIQLAADHFRSTEGKSYTPAQLTPVIRDNHGQLVTSLAIDAQSQTVAAGDDAGFLYVWNPSGQLTLKSVASFSGFRFHTLAFSRDGRYLAASARSAQTGASILQLWQLAGDKTPTLVREVRRAAAVDGLVFSRDGSALIIGNGRQIEVLATQQADDAQTIVETQSISLPSSVVFADQLPYRWKFNLADNQVAFDGEAMKWMETKDASWRNITDSNARFASGGWTLASQANAPQAPSDTWIMRGNQRIGRLDLDAHYQRRPESQVQQVAWINNQRNEVTGLAISLSGQNDIWVFALPPAGKNTCPLRRVFRGHEGSVLSLDASPDSRYLISSSQDCTVRLWPLIGLAEFGGKVSDGEETEPVHTKVANPATRTHWGFDFEVIDGRATAGQPYFTGPLYLKGMRAGDQLTEISYEQHQTDGTLRRTTHVDAEQIVDFLGKPHFDVPVRFIFTRGGLEVPGFQTYPHWREIAAQIIAANREWALWTPPGFYDASFNGNSLFGWQINRGLEQEPDFYRADRFQATLERPNFIRRLLATGSVEQAADLVGKPSIGFGDVLQNSITLQPRVNILSPVAGDVLSGRQATLRAEVILEQGQELATAKAYVSGVVATQRREVGRETLPDGQQRIELTWQAPLPSDQTLQLQVLCATRESLVGTDSLRLSRQNKPPANDRQAARKPRLYVIATGISKYRDSRIPSLELGAANAEGFMKTMLAKAGSVYDVVPLSLTDGSVTPNVWRSTVEQLDPRLQDASPDDVIVLFVSGHGLVDPSSGEYYFITANARYSDLVRQNYRDCLSFQELMRWVDVPCRKIAILDTCHSGAIQALDGQHLKQAVRTLQSDMVLTLTASEGDQLAAEYRGAQASLFSGAIQNTLQQLPDADGDGLLDWRELVQQVRKTVTTQSLSGAVPQFPMAGPKDLLEVIELPLAASRPQTLAVGF